MLWCRYCARVVLEPPPPQSHLDTTAVPGFRNSVVPTPQRGHRLASRRESQCLPLPLPLPVASAASAVPPRSTMLGARAGGYGRFSDDEHDAFRHPPPSSRKREWQELGNADVLIPKSVDFPLGVVHFVGGAGVGAFPRNAYDTFLQGLADAGGYSTTLLLQQYYSGTTAVVQGHEDVHQKMRVAQCQ